VTNGRRPKVPGGGRLKYLSSLLLAGRKCLFQ